MRYVLLLLPLAGPATGLLLNVRGGRNSTNSTAQTELDDAFLSTESLRRKVRAFHRTRDEDPVIDPVMTGRERQLFYSLLQNATYYQEFGAGGSTVTALRHPNILRVHSIESSQDWIRELERRSDVREGQKGGRLKLVHGNVGRTTEWGRPMTIRHRKEWPDYSGKHAQSDVQFDFVFVDGRFRVACLLKALARIPPQNRSNVALAMHDYTKRPQYHAVEQFVDLQKRAGRLAVFRPRPFLNWTDLRAAIERYEYIVDL